MKLLENNQRYAQLTDEHLIELCKLRMSNDNYNARIEQVIITERRHATSDKDYFYVRFELKTTQYGWDETGIMFKRFSIDEWDHIHNCLQDLGIVPVSKVISGKNDHIVNLECSQRGYQSAMKSLKKQLGDMFECITA